jgi:hypothetical protein
MIKKLPVILLLVVVVWVLYSSQFGQNLMNSVEDATGLDIPYLGNKMVEEAEAAAAAGPRLDLGMYDSYNPNAFGTTEEADRRITTDGVRKEYHKNPFPWAECTCDNGQCDKHGVPDPAIGHTHVCKNGFPSKRVIDMYGSHFQLNHMCAPGLADDGCKNEPASLGRWWCRKGCSNSESVGLDVRPACTRCG